MAIDPGSTARSTDARRGLTDRGATDRDLELHVDGLSLHADDVDLHTLPPWSASPCSEDRPALLRVPEADVTEHVRTTPSPVALMLGGAVLAIIVIVTVLVLL